MILSLAFFSFFLQARNWHPLNLCNVFHTQQSTVVKSTFPDSEEGWNKSERISFACEFLHDAWTNKCLVCFFTCALFYCCKSLHTFHVLLTLFTFSYTGSTEGKDTTSFGNSRITQERANKASRISQGNSLQCLASSRVTCRCALHLHYLSIPWTPDPSRSYLLSLFSPISFLSGLTLPEALT